MLLPCSHILSLSHPVSPSVCSCVTESVTPQQEVKESKLEAGREEVEGEEKVPKCRTASCLTAQQSNDRWNVWHCKKRKKTKGQMCPYLSQFQWLLECVLVIVQICMPMFICVCSCICLHCRDARQQQLGSPSSVLLSSINDQIGPSGAREPPATRTWLWMKDKEWENRTDEIGLIYNE